MPDRNEYRARALDCLADADHATDPNERDLLLKFAMVYVNLIKMVDSQRQHGAWLRSATAEPAPVME